MPPIDEPFAPASSVTTQRLRGLVQAGLAYAEARGKLFQIETQEAAYHATHIGKGAALGIGAVIGAWLLLTPALVSLIAKAASQPWEYIAIVIGAVHLIIAFVLLRRVQARLPQVRLFEESLNQLQKDREWIAGPQQPQQR
jgi:uncharacterized membrane protein YqjE